MTEQRKTVLLIDDDEALVSALATRLQTEVGVGTLCANNALTAVAMLQEQPDLVICDVKMPTANGLGILELMDEDERWHDIPMIVLTGCSDSNTLRRATNLSAYYVHKSGEVWTRLRHIVEELIDVRRIDDDAAAAAGEGDELVFNN